MRKLFHFLFLISLLTISIISCESSSNENNHREQPEKSSAKEEDLASSSPSNSTSKKDFTFQENKEFVELLVKLGVSYQLDQNGIPFYRNQFVGIYLNENLDSIDPNDHTKINDAKQIIIEALLRYIEGLDPNFIVNDTTLNLSRFTLCPCSSQIFLWDAGIDLPVDILEGDEKEGTASKPRSVIEEFGLDRNYITLSQLEDKTGNIVDESLTAVQLAALSEYQEKMLKDLNIKQKEFIDVAILDTGIDYLVQSTGYFGVETSLFPLWLNDHDHHQINGMNFHIGWDFVNEDPWPLDDHSHGTHVAGIILNKFNQFIKHVDSAAISSIRFMPLKTHDEHGIGSLYDIVCALFFAHEHGAEVINLSLGYYGEEVEVIRKIIELLVDDGVSISASLGNRGDTTGLLEVDTLLKSLDPLDFTFQKQQFRKGLIKIKNNAVSHYPSDIATIPIFNVAALGENERLWENSNRDRVIHHEAPGVNISSYYPHYLVHENTNGEWINHYGDKPIKLNGHFAIHKTGTSMATGYASAVCAAYKDQYGVDINSRLAILKDLGYSFSLPEEVRVYKPNKIGKSYSLIHPSDKK